jgi:transcriptional regulator with XRE-family HTH domain
MRLRRGIARTVKTTANASTRLGRNVARLRQSLNLTQEALAEKLDVSTRHIQSIEGGLRIPSLAVLTGLRKVLGCEWNDLFLGL